MAVTKQQVAELYVATFNRAPDATGLDYWVNESFGGHPTIELIAQSFFDQPETQALYPEGTTNTAFVSSIYHNLFNRAPDAAGLAYWVAELDNGTLTRSVMIEAMVNGALDSDVTIIANKATVGLYYADAGLVGTDFSLASVTADATTVTAAQTTIDIDAGVFTLTSSVTTVDEGSAVEFTIHNGAANTEYVYKVTGVSAADVAEDAIAIVTTDANGNATFSLTAAADALTEGAETMTVSIVGQNVSNAVVINDTSVNTAPVVTASQAFNIAENATVTTAVGTVAATDADADTMTYAMTDDSGLFAINASTGAISLATASLNAETTASYTVSVVATDAKGLASAATNITINVTDVNDNAPVATADTATTNEDTAVTIDVLANDTDADATAANNTLTISATSVAEGDAVGTVTVVDGQVVFTPAANYNGSATVNYTVTDGLTAVDSTVAVTVNAVNDAPVITSAETSAISGSGSNNITATAVVTDVEGNWNGGSIVITTEDGFYFGQNGNGHDATGLTAAGAASTYTFSVASGSIIATNNATLAAVIIGSITNNGATVLTDAGAGADDTVLTGYTVSLNANVTSTIVTELLTVLKVDDVVKIDGVNDPVGASANITVTVTDGAGGSTSFTRLLDSSATAIANLSDSREIEVADATDGTELIDLSTNATLTAGGLGFATTTLTLSSDIAGDQIDAVNGVYTVVSGQVVKNGNTIIGSVTGNDTNNVTFTFNDNAAAADAQAIIQQALITTTDAIGDHTVSVSIDDGAGSHASQDIVLSVVGDFTTVTLAALRAADVNAPVTIDSNINLTVAVGDNAASADLAQKIADGEIIVTGDNLIRIQVTGSANISDVTGFSGLGTVSVTAIASGATLTMDAADVDGVSVAGAGSVAVTGLENTLDADLSGLAATTANTATLDTTAGSVTFTGDLGSVDLIVAGTNTLTVDVSIIDGLTVTDSAAADLTLTGLGTTSAFDLSGITFDNGGAVNVAFTTDTTLNAATDLGATGAVYTVAQDTTLTLSAAQASGKTIAGDDATTYANTGGSIVVTDMTVDADLSSLSAGGNGSQVGASAGTLTMTIDADLTLTTANIGSFIVTVAEDVTLTSYIANLTGKTVNGAGTVAIVGIDANLDMSHITTTTSTVSYAASQNISNNTIDFGAATVSVAADAVLTVNASDALGVTMNGATATATHTGGSFVVVVDGTDAYDLSTITAGAAGLGTVGTLVATIATANQAVDADTNFGTASITLGQDADLVITAAQADGRTIIGTNAGAAETITVDISSAASDLDLSHVGANITTLTLASTGSVNLSAMSLDQTASVVVNDGDNAVDAAYVVTMTAAQANAMNIANSGAAVVTLTSGDAQDTISLTTTAYTVDATHLLGAEVSADSDYTNEIGVTYVGSAGNDNLAGSNAEDNITGGAGNDVISAGTGDDTITGGAGKDTMTGGDGDDTFVFALTTDSVVGSNRDIITDFTDAGIAGGDVIDLSAIAGGTLVFIGTDSFTNAATNEVRYTVINGNAIVEIDADNDGVADMQIQVTGVDTLAASDFSL